MVEYILNMIRDYCVVSEISVQWIQTYWIGCSVIFAAAILVAGYFIWKKIDVD